jgi:hypothetical protein
MINRPIGIIVDGKIRCTYPDCGAFNATTARYCKRCSNPAAIGITHYRCLNPLCQTWHDLVHELSNPNQFCDQCGFPTVPNIPQTGQPYGYGVRVQMLGSILSLDEYMQALFIMLSAKYGAEQMNITNRAQYQMFLNKISQGTAGDYDQKMFNMWVNGVVGELPRILGISPTTMRQDLAWAKGQDQSAHTRNKPASPPPYPGGKYQVNFGGTVTGLAIGDEATITQNFGKQSASNPSIARHETDITHAHTRMVTYQTENKSRPHPSLLKKIAQEANYIIVTATWLQRLYQSNEISTSGMPFEITEKVVDALLAEMEITVHLLSKSGRTEEQEKYGLYRHLMMLVEFDRSNRRRTEAIYPTAFDAVRYWLEYVILPVNFTELEKYLGGTKNSPRVNPRYQQQFDDLRPDLDKYISMAGEMYRLEPKWCGYNEDLLDQMGMYLTLKEYLQQ